MKKYSFDSLKEEDKDFALGIYAAIALIKNEDYALYIERSPFDDGITDFIRYDTSRAIIRCLEKELDDYYVSCIEGE